MKRPGRKFVWITTPIILLGIGIALYFYLRRTPTDFLEVPLGVEEAVIVTYNGVAIEPIPFKWGVDLNVRIAEVVEHEGNRVYDIRYIVNRAGEYDLKRYFRGTNGKPAEGFPSFRVRGSNELSKDIESRIVETENVQIALQARYHETLIASAVLWILWLLGLIFWRRKQAAPALTDVKASVLADEIRRNLALLESGSLDTAQQARLELMIFRQWREQQSLAEAPMSQVLARFRSDPDVAAAYAELENWLHRTDRTHSAAPVANAVRARLRSSPTPSPMEPVAS